VSKPTDDSAFEESGRVVMVRGSRAEVEVIPHSGCDHCSAVSFCHWTGSRAKRVLAHNRINAREGDMVVISRSVKQSARSSLVVFGLPALLMLGGVVLGRILFQSDTWAAGFAGVGLVVALVVVKVADAAVVRTGAGLPVIVRRLTQQECKGVDDENVARSDAGDGRDWDVELR